MPDYHEPREELGAEVRDLHRAISSLREELEAIDWYSQRVAACTDDALAATLRHARDDEIEHTCMLLEWLRSHHPTWDEELRARLFVGAEAPGGEPSAASDRATGREISMDHLRRAQAPIDDRTWNKLEREAVAAFDENVALRRAVELDGPHGYALSSINVARLATGEGMESQGVSFGVRQVQPLLEARVGFRISTQELQDAARGAEDFDTTEALAAARKLAAFEERALFYGLSQANIAGLCDVTAHETIALGENPGNHPKQVAQALLKLSEAGVSGPYVLLLESRLYRLLAGDVSDYPPLGRIEKLLEGKVLHSPVLEGGLLLSRRGGDYRMTIGEDVRLGYEGHDAGGVNLYLTETFTFRALSHEAIVRLR